MCNGLREDGLWNLWAGWKPRKGKSFGMLTNNIEKFKKKREISKKETNEHKAQNQN